MEYCLLFPTTNYRKILFACFCVFFYPKWAKCSLWNRFCESMKNLYTTLVQKSFLSILIASSKVIECNSCFTQWTVILLWAIISSNSLSFFKKQNKALLIASHTSYSSVTTSRVIRVPGHTTCVQRIWNYLWHVMCCLRVFSL